MYDRENKNNFKKVKSLVPRSKRNKWSKMISFIKKIYAIISVISTLTIFSAMMLFLIGKMGLETSSDDDLIMRDIKRQMPNNLSIASIRMEDIHGFGNDSIIVLADEGMGTEERAVANQILIFDKVENDVLNQIYHLFGYGSNYKLSYMFSLGTDEYADMNLGYSLNLLDVIELTGDFSKELVVSFTPLPAGTSASYDIGILSYSFEKQRYYMLGTYPETGKYDIGDTPYVTFQEVESKFHSENPSQFNFYDKNERFMLESGCSDDNDFFIANESGSLYLVRTKMIWGSGESHVDPHKHIISVFSHNYNLEKDEIEWNVIFSKETTSYIPYCTKEFVVAFLRDNGMYYFVGDYLE